ncbi:LADA_0E04632g1_1 [Lachancea dasiensis]|uniref:LADA_0E04632g1_1 n=1 Tax=Lachancea dasiensis TaxID=1072105 RepID=A0A1G4JBX2_9SACH|nr:LADA_0E04632g1_1 [Lachancea dasiensis]
MVCRWVASYIDPGARLGALLALARLRCRSSRDTRLHCSHSLARPFLALARYSTTRLVPLVPGPASSGSALISPLTPFFFSLWVCPPSSFFSPSARLANQHCRYRNRSCHQDKVSKSRSSAGNQLVGALHAIVLLDHHTEKSLYQLPLSDTREIF